MPLILFGSCFAGGRRVFRTALSTKRSSEPRADLRTRDLFQTKTASHLIPCSSYTHVYFFTSIFILGLLSLRIKLWRRSIHKVHLDTYQQEKSWGWVHHSSVDQWVRESFIPGYFTSLFILLCVQRVNRITDMKKNSIIYEHRSCFSEFPGRKP